MEEVVPPPRNKQEIQPAILIVEDHFMTRWAAAEYFRRRGFKVLEAVNVTEALALASTGNMIDVVFSDVQLGEGQDGHELAQWFGKHRPQVPVLLTSGADDQDVTPRSELRSFVRKPYEFSQVESLLRSMIQRR